MWRALHNIARWEHSNIHKEVEKAVELTKTGQTHTSAVRVYIVEYFTRIMLEETRIIVDRTRMPDRTEGP